MYKSASNPFTSQAEGGVNGRMSIVAICLAKGLESKGLRILCFIAPELLIKLLTFSIGGFFLIILSIKLSMLPDFL